MQFFYGLSRGLKIFFTQASEKFKSIFPRDTYIIYVIQLNINISDSEMSSLHVLSVLVLI